VTKYFNFIASPLICETVADLCFAGGQRFKSPKCYNIAILDGVELERFNQPPKLLLFILLLLLLLLITTINAIITSLNLT